MDKAFDAETKDLLGMQQSGDWITVRVEQLGLIPKGSYIRKLSHTSVLAVENHQLLARTVDVARTAVIQHVVWLDAETGRQVEPSVQARLEDIYSSHIGDGVA